jgi:hypothetical protein
MSRPTIFQQAPGLPLADRLEMPATSVKLANPADIQPAQPKRQDNIVSEQLVPSEMIPTHQDRLDHPFRSRLVGRRQWGGCARR